MEARGRLHREGGLKCSAPGGMPQETRLRQAPSGLHCLQLTAGQERVAYLARSLSSCHEKRKGRPCTTTCVPGCSMWSAAEDGCVHPRD